jgi:hypothetical protein
MQMVGYVPWLSSQILQLYAVKIINSCWILGSIRNIYLWDGDRRKIFLFLDNIILGLDLLHEKVIGD